MDVGSLLATLVDCHQEGLAEQWVTSLGRQMQVPFAPQYHEDSELIASEAIGLNYNKPPRHGFIHHSMV